MMLSRNSWSRPSPPAVEPVEDAAGLLVAGDAGGHGLGVQEGEAVVPWGALEVDPADEPAGVGVPEPRLEVTADRVAERADLRRGQRPLRGGDRPVGMVVDSLLHRGITAEGLPEPERGEGIVAAERQQVPVVSQASQSVHGMKAPGRCSACISSSSRIGRS
jgi:hypothetical protein